LHAKNERNTAAKNLVILHNYSLTIQLNDPKQGVLLDDAKRASDADQFNEQLGTADKGRFVH
jgi:hypothetical protein